MKLNLPPKYIILLILTVWLSYYIILGMFLTHLVKRMASVSAQEAGMYSIVYVTAPNETNAKEMAHGVVSGKLAACVNIVPKIISIYTWEDKINEDEEVLMMMKTRSSAVSKLIDYIKGIHPYKVCEVISAPIEKGNVDYLNWIGSAVP